MHTIICLFDFITLYIGIAAIRRTQQSISTQAFIHHIDSPGQRGHRFGHNRLEDC